jgi:hypothetical protein
MSGFEHRIDIAEAWFERHVIDSPEGGAGWGWVPDVPPNPQNTAEVVCALNHVGRRVPREADALALIRQEVVSHAARGDWAFQSLIDVTWRLRALRSLVPGHTDSEIVACAEALIEAQDSITGGWRLAGKDGPVSITATASAVQALLGLESTVDTTVAVRRGIMMLIGAIVDDDPRAEPLYASAQILDVLARHEITVYGGARTEHAQKKALDRVIGCLERRQTGVQEEVFTRGTVTDIWRHMTLYLSLAAVAKMDASLVFTPAYRGALIEMLELQEGERDGVNFGGFRTSREGYVTSYATTQALHVLATLKETLAERVNPGLVFDVLCKSGGEHHSDPQTLLTIRRRPVVLNSWAGAVLLTVGLVAGLTVGGLTIAERTQLTAVESRLLLIWSTMFLALGTFGFAAVRLPRVSNGRIAFAVFTGFSAVFLPIIFFVFS